MAADVSKNAADVENYSKEFLELQDQLHQMNEKFNGVELFVQDGETLQGVNTAHLTTTSDTLYEYFDDPTQSARKQKLGMINTNMNSTLTPSGKADDGSVKLNIVNLEFLLGIKNQMINLDSRIQLLDKAQLLLLLAQQQAILILTLHQMIP